MLETFKYINHLNEVIEFGKNGIYVDYNTLRDYSWDITSANNKIASFKKGIVSKTIPIIIKCNSEAEGIEVKNRLFEVFEKDVLAKKNGKIIIGDYYLKCYITGTKKTKYLIDKGYLHLSLTMKTDYPAWIKESYTIFRPKSALNTSESAEGREILIGNATNSILTNYAVYGRSEQKSYKGHQLFDYSKIPSKTQGGATVTNNGDGTFAVSGSGTLTAQFKTYYALSKEECLKLISNTGNYTLENLGDKTSPSVGITFRNSSGGTIADFGLYDTNTRKAIFTQEMIDSISSGELYFYSPSGREITTGNVKPFFYYGDNNTYEPVFVGGEASPNPNYPQAIESVADIGKNQIANSAVSQTINGVEFVVNSDGSVTINGTATEDAKLIISEIKLPIGDYVAYGGYDVNCDLWCYATYSTTPYMRSGGNSFHIQVLNENTTLTFYILVTAGTTVDNKTVYPMVINQSIGDLIYEPPYNFLWVNTHSKNLLENTATSQTVNGITFTINKDKSMSVSGTSTDVAQIEIGRLSIKNTDIILSDGGLKTLGSSWLFIHGYKNGVGTYNIANTNKGECKLNSGDYDEIMCGIYVPKGQTLSNVTFYPMIRLASIDDDSYVPYNATKATIILNDSHRGLKVSEGGNFTDETGQQWVCDSLEKYADGSGKLVQRIGKSVADGTNVKATYKSGTATDLYMIHIGSSVPAVADSVKGNLMCSHFIANTFNNLWYGAEGISLFRENGGQFRISFSLDRGINTIDLCNEWLQENNITIYYEMADYIETPLTAEQVAEIEKLQTFEGVTYITNNDNAYQEVTYSIKQYLDFPYGYEYDFTADFDSDELLNTSFVPVDFRMVIHGAVANPSVFIAGHEYSVDVTVEQGDYLTIDSQQKTIVLTKKDGTQVNCFNYRNRDSYVFEKIPSGKNEITSANDLNIDITLLDERSEPKWT